MHRNIDDTTRQEMIGAAKMNMNIAKQYVENDIEQLKLHFF